MGMEPAEIHRIDGEARGPQALALQQTDRRAAQQLRAHEPDDGDAHGQQGHERQQPDAKALERAPDQSAAQCDFLVPSLESPTTGMMLATDK